MLTKEISKRLDTNERVVVFTQSMEMALAFLMNENGRWKVSANPRYWRVEDMVRDGMGYGETLDGFKVRLGSYKDPDVGFDLQAGRLIFTKNPHFPLEAKDFVIKDEFNYGKFEISPDMNYLAALQAWEPVVICCRDFHQYFHVNDDLTMLEIPHSNLQSGEILPVHVTNKSYPAKPGTTVLAYGFRSIYEIMSFNEAKRVILVHDKEYDTPSYEEVDKIMRCFVEMPDEALSPDYIAFKTMRAEERVKRDLEFISLTGKLRTGQTHLQEITIRKKGQVDDEMFMRIPEGTFKIEELIKYLMVNRDNLIDVLKKYDKNIDFAYLPSNHNLFYFAKDEVSQGKYDTAKNFYVRSLHMLKSLEMEGARYINRELEIRIEKHCLSNNVSAVLHRSGTLTDVSPGGQSISHSFQSPPSPGLG